MSKGAATCCLWAAFVLLAMAGCAKDSPPASGLAAEKTGRIEFESHHTEWAGPADPMRPASAVTLTGWLSLPEPRNGGAVPAVIMIHGSSGLHRAHKEQYVARLNRAGIATFLVDSFAPRGIRDTRGAKQARLTLDNQTHDAFRALERLRSHPRIDPERIAIAGWSRGGAVADYASRELYRRTYIRHSAGAPANLAFAAHLAVYPFCGLQEARLDQTGSPKLFLLGGADDWTGHEVCMDYVERMRQAGHDVRAIVYEDAHHAFDAPGDFTETLADARSWTECKWIRTRQGLIDMRTGEFHEWGRAHRAWHEWAESCTTPGVTVATNAAARKRALEDAARFLTSVLTP